MGKISGLSVFYIEYICPHCGSGNWVFGYIDDPEIDDPEGEIKEIGE